MLLLVIRLSVLEMSIFYTLHRINARSIHGLAYSPLERVTQLKKLP